MDCNQSNRLNSKPKGDGTSPSDNPSELTDRLNSLAADILLSDLRRFGNEPSQEQEAALRLVLSTYTDIALNGVEGRFAVPLNTGLGKTRSVVAWLTAVNRLGLDHSPTEGVGVSVMVSAGKVEALCQLKRDLIDAGIPERKVGLVHSYKHNTETAEAYLCGNSGLPSGYASEPCNEDYTDRPFLLLTHQMIKGKSGVARFNVHRERPRSLVIWDESLLSSDTFAFEDDRVRASRAWLQEMDRVKSPERDEALEYLRTACETIRKEMSQQQADPERKPRSFKLGSLSGEDIEKYKSALVGGQGGFGSGEQAELLCDLLDVSQDELRVLANVEQGGGVITFRVSVPRELRNIVVLDASFPIRELAQLDPSIKQIDIPSNIVSYETVTVYQLDYPSGRNTMEKEFSKKRGQNKVSREVIEVLKSIPESEAVLIFTFKGRGRLDYRKLLERDLESAGIDIEATVEANGVLRPRVNFLSWGQETSLNAYSFCSNVILCGILQRSHIDIGGAIVGQTGDLLRPVTNSEIREVVQSEIAHAAYQALSRGSSRVLRTGQASPMKVWLLHPFKENLRGRLEVVLPGVRWTEWKGKHLLSKSAQRKATEKTPRVVQTIRSYLDSLPSAVTSVSTRKMKAELGLVDCSSDTFSRSLKRAVEGSDWTLCGRTVVKTFVHFFGPATGYHRPDFREPSGS